MLEGGVTLYSLELRMVFLYAALEIESGATQTLLPTPVAPPWPTTQRVDYTPGPTT